METYNTIIKIAKEVKEKLNSIRNLIAYNKEFYKLNDYEFLNSIIEDIENATYEELILLCSVIENIKGKENAR